MVFDYNKTKSRTTKQNRVYSKNYIKIQNNKKTFLKIIKIIKYIKATKKTIEAQMRIIYKSVSILYVCIYGTLKEQNSSHNKTKKNKIYIYIQNRMRTY